MSLIIWRICDENAKRAKRRNEKREEYNGKDKCKMKKLTAYVDGSYNKDTKVYGYGVIIITDTEELHRSGIGIDKEGVWNVAGEITGAVDAIEYALENGYDELTICHDYEGIQKWADREWKAKKKISSDYVKYVDDARNSGLVIKFRWVKGHSGDPYNEKADRLAKQSIIITDRQEFPQTNGLIFGESGTGMGFCYLTGKMQKVRKGGQKR